VVCVRWLFTVYGSASPSASGASGDFTLTSQDVYGSFGYIRVPKGLKAKVWAKRLSGTVGFTLQISVTDDVTASPPTWSVIDSEHLASAGSLELEKRRPIVVHARTGKEGVKLSYANTTGAGTIYAVVEVEITDEED
jgi:hypothetical protein